MHYKKDSHGLFLKLDKGEDLFASLEKVAEKELPRGGMVVMAIGMLKDSIVGYYNGKEYEKRTFEKGHELLGLHGSIRVFDGETPEEQSREKIEGNEIVQNKISLHIHCIMANEKHEVVGGHLFSATVDPLVEMLIIPAEISRITVQFNEITGLDEMKVE